MVASKQCLLKYGEAEKESHMVLFDVPTNLEAGVIPKRIYCNKDMISPLTIAFTNIVTRKLTQHLKTFDGCFNIRKKRGSSTQSLHSWGIAIDINAAWNGFGKQPTLRPDLVRCFTDAGFEWGGAWSKPDGMHFQLAKI